MKIIVFAVIMIFVVMFISCEKEVSIQNLENYGYDNWPGKNGDVKTDIEIADQFVTAYDMSLRSGSSETYLRFEIALNENDTTKQGYLHLRIFPTIEEAQLALVEYLDIITAFPKPPRLTNEDFNAGDVAFGKKFDGNVKMCFTRNNVFVIIYAPTGKAGEIAHKIDIAVQNAPEWKEGMEHPKFI